ncbi:MAG: peptidoglycan DD-metalloendopeptidase family protein [Pseudomonadota bacterium]
MKIQQTLFLFSLVLLCTMSVQAQETRATKKSIDELNNRISEISKQLNSQKKQQKKEEHQLYLSETASNKLNAEIATIETKISAQTKLKNETADSLTSLNTQVGALKGQLTELIQKQYVQGGDVYLKQLLNQENPYTLGRLNNYRQYFGEAMLNRLEDIARITDGLNQQQREYQRILTELQGTKEQQQQKQRQLAAENKRRAKSIAAIDKELNSSQAQLLKLQQDRNRLEVLLEQIRKQTRAQEKLVKNNAKKLPPVPGGFLLQKGRLTLPCECKLSTAFGQRETSSGIKSQGLVLKAAKNTEVTSIFRGRVIFSDYLKGFGLLLIVDHGDDHLSLYAHNQKLLKKVGAQVETNEKIALVGNSGGKKETALYFEIRHNASPVNPMIWLN